jgi:hypothetical protein
MSSTSTPPVPDLDAPRWAQPLIPPTLIDEFTFHVGAAAYIVRAIRRYTEQRGEWGTAEVHERPDDYGSGFDPGDFLLVRFEISEIKQ